MLAIHAAITEKKATGGVCLDDVKLGIECRKAAVGAGPGGWRTVLHHTINLEITIEGQ